MNVLITGHAGFIGSHVADYFHERGHIVFGVGRSLSWDCRYSQYEIDIEDCHALSSLASEKCIDLIVHLAGKAIVADCAKDPFSAFMVNGLGTAAVLEAARYAKVRKVVAIETDKVYGLQDEMPTNEDASLNPGSPYELSKALAAIFCDFYREHYDLDVVSVRPVNVFGPGDYSFTRIIPAAMRAAIEGRGIPVQAHAVNMRRDFIYVKDVARMVYTLATEKTAHGIYNLSPNASMTIMELAKRITDVLGCPDPVIVEKPGKYSEIAAQSIDGSRFVKEFGFEFTPPESAILETYAAYRQKLGLPVLGRDDPAGSDGWISEHAGLCWPDWGRVSVRA
jgi:UDP-glucose 4-epimerase